MNSNFVACDNEVEKNQDNVIDTTLEIGGFKKVPGRDDLVYSEETKVVYYLFSIKETDFIRDSGYGYSFFAPYLNENLRYCYYIDGKLVEADK